MKKIYVVTGASGAGASTAKYVFEELGYYILENFPVALTDDLVTKVIEERPRNENVCLIVKISDVESLWEKLRQHSGYKLIPVLLDCDKDELMRRFVLTRHMHPDAVKKKIELNTAIEHDIKIVEKIKKEADIYIDTTKCTVKEFRTILYNKILGNEKEHITQVGFVSFGIKNGVKKDIDMMIDCRTMPNPYWVESLKEKNGLDKEIVDYLYSFPETKVFLDKVTEFLEYHLAEMQKSGRGFYTIGVACSGGHHRSTFVADYLGKYFSKKYTTHVYHRDCPELNN